MMAACLASVKGLLCLSLLAHVLVEVASLRTGNLLARKVRELHGNEVSRSEPLTDEEDGWVEEEAEGQSAEYSTYWDHFKHLSLGSVSFSQEAGPLSVQRVAGGLEVEPKDLHPERSLHLNFSEVGGACNSWIRPFADFDHLQGHGNPKCRYEPSVDELKKFKANPIDLAIIMPHDGITGVAEDEVLLATWEESSAYSWRAYARYHNYAFYAGKIADATEACAAELEDRPSRRASAWLKPCAALHLIRKHKYLLVVDSDTFVTKPLLRMEPLFEKTGLLSESSGKAMALAAEWGSCRNGMRRLKAGPVNTGVVLLKHTAEEMLKAWFYNPGCPGGLPPPGREPPGHGRAPRDCSLFEASRKAWAYDQLGLAVAVLPRYGPNVTVLPSGCPVNGPWGDFISHVVGGSFNHSFYDPSCREAIVPAAQRCIARALRVGGDPYHRCSLCSLLPGGDEDFSISCPRRSQSSGQAAGGEGHRDRERERRGGGGRH